MESFFFLRSAKFTFGKEKCQSDKKRENKKKKKATMTTKTSRIVIICIVLREGK